LRALIGKSGLPDVICGKFVEGRGIDLFKEVCQRNLEGVVAKRKNGTYATVSGWLKIKNYGGTNCLIPSRPSKRNDSRRFQRSHLYEADPSVREPRRRRPVNEFLFLKGTPALHSL
jgi:hypothetical protein